MNVKEALEILYASFHIEHPDEEEKWLKGIIILLSIMSILMGLSRLLLSHHYATDVIAGVLFGALFGIMDFYLYKYFPNFVAFLKSKFKKA